MNNINPLHVVLERLGCGDPVKGALFFWDEVKKWPSGSLDILVTSGLLKPAQPMTNIECDGCEENCFMPVTVYPAQEDKPGRAFITCDKRDDIGRVRVDFRRMEQWQTTGGMLAEFLTRLLGFAQLQQEDSTRKRWVLGMLTSKKYSEQATLVIDSGISLQVAGHGIPLMEILKFDNGAFSANKDELLRLASKPKAQPVAQGSAPDTLRREVGKLKTQKQYANWQQAYKELKQKPQNKSKSDVWFSQQIAKLEIANGCDSETIRKHMTK
ncbi:MAG: hypothetical protein HHJ12_18325 [Glaciimonas sp.]|nr:hypothetical protein [Glaciimonas sp.]